LPLSQLLLCSYAVVCYAIPWLFISETLAIYNYKEA
jgi:hypothetical protein